jgi:hypothetical protein
MCVDAALRGSALPRLQLLGMGTEGTEGVAENIRSATCPHPCVEADVLLCGRKADALLRDSVQS